MRKNRRLAVLLLSFLFFPPLIPLTSQGPGGPKLMTSSTSTSTNRVTFMNDTENVTETSTIEEWTNGTLLHFSTRIPEVQDLTINCTTWINTTLSGESAASTTASQRVVSGDLPTVWIDGLEFLECAKNDSCSTSYEHDNNYEMYFPRQWGLPYYLNGTVDRHVHLWSSLLSSWILGNLTNAAAIVAGLLTGKLLETLLSVSETDVFAAVADWLGCPELVAVWYCKVAYDYIDQIAKMYGYLTTAWWVYNTVVEKYSGDGWMWASPQVLVAGCWRLDQPYYYRSLLWKRYYEIRSYNQSWGTEGIEQLSSSNEQVNIVWKSQDITMDAPAGVWYPERVNEPLCP
jgi:hypothetical protein